MPQPIRQVISPGQGLLLLIDHYKYDADKTKQLKKIYLSGAGNESEQQDIKRLLEDKILAGYQISYDAKVINDDPTRRYFETHLSYESLKHGLDKIDLAELTSHTDALIKMLPPETVAHVAYVLNGELRPSDDDPTKEYANYIAKIKSGEMFGNFSSEDRAKIELIVKSSFLGVVNVGFTSMPLDIYGTGIYEDVNKGKTMIEGQETTRNQNLGLMKGHMPLSLDDVARGTQAAPLLKPSDQATFIEHAAWPAMSFDKMVHPFSNSISGTMLCQLRAIAKLRNDGACTFTASGENMAQYGRLFTSVMLFGSGGHTLNEFTAPLSLQETRNEFGTTPGFEQISLESMFLLGNETGFDSALEDTIGYNAMILQRQRLIVSIVQGHLSGLITNEADPSDLLALSSYQLNTEQRRQIWTVIQGPLQSGTLIKNIRQLYRLLALSPEELNADQRLQILTAVEGKFGEMITNGSELRALLELSPEQLNTEQREQILKAVEKRLSTLITNGDDLCFLLELPPGQFDANQKKRFLTSVEEQWGTLITSGGHLLALLDLPPDQLNAEQKNLVLTALQDRLGTFITNGANLVDLLGASSDKLNSEHKRKIWTAAEGLLSTLVTNGGTLSKLLELDSDIINSEQKRKIWTVAEGQLNSLFKNDRQLLNLFRLTTDQLNADQRNLILTATQGILNDLIDAEDELEPFLKNLLKLPPEQLNSEQREQVLKAVKKQFSNWVSTEDGTRTLLALFPEQLSPPRSGIDSETKELAPPTPPQIIQRYKSILADGSSIPKASSDADAKQAPKM